jgi:hypothetical protein
VFTARYGLNFHSVSMCFSRRLLNTEVRVRSQVSPCYIRVGKVVLGQVFLPVLGFSSVSIIPPCSILIYMLLLAGQTDEGWEPSHKQRFSVNRGAKDGTALSLFPPRFTSSFFMLGCGSCCPRVPHYLYISKVCVNKYCRYVFQTTGSRHRLALNQARTYECRIAKPCTTACVTALYGRSVLLIRAGKERCA